MPICSFSTLLHAICFLFPDHWVHHLAARQVGSSRYIYDLEVLYLYVGIYGPIGKSYLAKEFDLQGKVGDWDIAAQLGNLMHSMQIRDMIKGSHNQWHMWHSASYCVTSYCVHLAHLVAKSGMPSQVIVRSVANLHSVLISHRCLCGARQTRRLQCIHSRKWLENMSTFLSVRWPVEIKNFDDWFCCTTTAALVQYAAWDKGCRALASDSLWNGIQSSIIVLLGRRYVLDPIGHVVQARLLHQ